MMISDLWPLIAASALVIFGSGQLVEKIRNNNYVRKDSFGDFRKDLDRRLDKMENHLSRIESKFDNEIFRA